MADVRLVVRKLGLGGKSASAVELKAREFLRRSIIKLGQNSLGQAEIAKPAICVELACLTLQVPVDAHMIVKCSGATMKQYKRAKSMLMKGLQVRQKITHGELCVQFGCMKLDDVVAYALEEYKERVKEASGQEIDVCLPKYVGAAFYLVAKAYKVRVSRKRLLDSLGIEGRELNKCLKDMGDRMHDVFGRGDDGNDGECIEGRNNSMVSHQKKKEMTEQDLRAVIEMAQCDE